MQVFYPRLNLLFRSLPVALSGLLLLANFLLSQPAWAQASGLRVNMNSEGAYAALDEQGTVVIPYEKRPLVVLTPNLVKVSATYTHEKWGMLDRQNHLLLPMEYDYLEAAGSGYLQGRKGDESFLFNSKGETIHHESGKLRFAAYARFNRLLVEHIEAGPNERTDAVRILDLHTKRQVFAQSPSAGIEPLHIDWNTAPGNKKHASGMLPFFEVRAAQVGTGAQKVVDAQGKVLFDNIDRAIFADAGGVVYLYSEHQPVIVTDTLLRPIPWLSGQYDGVRRNGPANRYWQISRAGKSGMLDGKGRVVLPLQYPGQLHYAGANNYLLSEYRGNVTYRSLITADRRLIDLAQYYIEDGIDTTLARKPILLKNQKTYKTGIFDPQHGFIVPVRYDLLERSDKGIIFFQQDSAGYMDARGHVQLLTPNCQILSAYSEGYAVCGKLVANATREKFPSAQIIYAAQGSSAAQYAYMDATGKLVSGYFDWVGPFRGGYAQVIKNNETFMVDTKGQKAVFGAGGILVSYFQQGLAVVRQGRYVGLVDKAGRMVVPAQYRAIETTQALQGNSTLVSKANKGNHLLSVVIPKIADGTVEVTTEDGKKSRLTVEVSH
jgi:DNA-binding transcriptional regulator/RsmH inhibitor MraZ